MGKHHSDEDNAASELGEAVRKAKAAPRKDKRTHADDVEQTEKDYGINLRGKGKK